MNTLRSLAITAPEPLCAQLPSSGSPARIISACLALVFEAASQLDDEGKDLVRAVVEGVVLRTQARRFRNAS